MARRLVSPAALAIALTLDHRILNASVHSNLPSADCLGLNFDPEKSPKISAGSFNDEIPPTLISQIKEDANGLFLMGLSRANSADDAAAKVKGCIQEALNRFIFESSLEKHKANEDNALQVAAGAVQLSEEVWLRIIQVGDEFYCLRIMRISKSSLNSYFSKCL